MLCKQKMSKIKSIHGHYSNIFEDETKKIIENFKKQLGIDITWTEATAIAAMRSANSIWTEKQLKEVLSKIRGII